PGLAEFEELTKSGAETPAALVAAARPLVDRGAGAVIITRGPLGMVAVTADGAWDAHLPEPLTGNPTGAGDTVAAAVIAALADANPPDWPAILVDAVATSAASVVIPVAGEIDRRLRGHLAPTVVVSELETPSSESPRTCTTAGLHPEARHETEQTARRRRVQRTPQPVPAHQTNATSGGVEHSEPLNGADPGDHHD